MKRSRSVSLSKPLGVSNKAPVLLVPLAVASAFVLSGCDTNKEYASLAACEARNGSGSCVQEPRPTLMNEENRPVYVKQDDCTKDFGEESCAPEERKSGRVYRPLYTAGQTYFYPVDTGHRGYYKGSINMQPPTYSPFVRKFGFGGSARAFGAAASS